MGKILIQNGIVYNGKDDSGVKQDIRIENERIAEVGTDLLQREGEMVINAGGMTVTPGFIDIHRHCDKSPLEQEQTKGDYGQVLLRQGITTVITGNCGISMYPLHNDPDVIKQMQNYYEPVLGNIRPYSSVASYRDYMEKLSDCSLPVNTGAMIGMGAVRIAVKGFDAGRFTAEEIETCKGIIRDALDAGAPGASIGLMYLPECHESAEELGEILKPVGAAGKIVTAHIRGEGDSLVKSIEEAILIGRLAECRMEISHLKSCGTVNWNREIYRAIACIEEARRNGQQVVCDFYPYDCGSTTLMSMIPPTFVNGDIGAALKRLESKAGQEVLRSLLKENYPDWDNYAVSLGWDKVILSSVSKEENKKMLGKSIPEITESFGFFDEVEAVSWLLTSENGTAAIIIRSMSQADVDVISALPYSCLISDAIYAETDRPHPRMYGAFPKFLADFVKERKVLSFSEAIRKMTSMPAERLGILHRGQIREGFYADLNIFNPEVFHDCATYLEPARLAEGLSYCLINGEIVVKDDQVLSTKKGKLLQIGR